MLRRRWRPQREEPATGGYCLHKRIPRSAFSLFASIPFCAAYTASHTRQTSSLRAWRSARAGQVRAQPPGPLKRAQVPLTIDWNRQRGHRNRGGRAPQSGRPLPGPPAACVGSYCVPQAGKLARTHLQGCMGAVGKQAVQRAERGAAGRLDARLPHAPPHAHPCVRLPSHPLPPMPGRHRTVCTPAAPLQHPTACGARHAGLPGGGRAAGAGRGGGAGGPRRGGGGQLRAAHGRRLVHPVRAGPQVPRQRPQIQVHPVPRGGAPLHRPRNDRLQPVGELAAACGGRARPPSAVARPPHAPRCTHPHSHPPDRHRTPATHPPIHPTTQPSTPPGSATRRTCRRGRALRARRAPWTL